SLFGDSYIEIIPTGGPEGAAPARLLRSGEPILHVIEGASTDAALRAMESALPRINNVLEVLHEVMLDGRKLINGAVPERLGVIDGWLAQGRIEGPLRTAQAAMVRVDDLTARGAAALTDLSPDLISTLGRVDKAVAEARQRIGAVRSDVIDGLREARTGLDAIDEPARQAAEVMAAINNGEGDDFKGTLGRLVNDKELGETLDDAAASGREAVSSFYRFKSWLGMRLELNVFSRIPRFYAVAEIRARTDKFYLIEFERGGLGGIPSDQISDASGTSELTRRQEIKDTLRFTMQFGKQTGPLAIRAGIKDSTFGAGVDAHMLSGRLKVSADVFGGFSRTPRLKLAAAFAVFRSIYVIAGIDDALNEPGYLSINKGLNQEVPDQLTEVRYGRDWFLGASLHFDDADLATLLRVYGAVLAGALAF
ncbi:MAG: hypothetical protein H0T42_09425, partial [Deltaproteobacteria bacterium]|nr:hypothetical protein [Deltaproteobacteria bacterium]